MTKPAVSWPLSGFTGSTVLERWKKKKLSYRWVLRASVLLQERFACLSRLILLVSLAHGTSVLSERITLTIVLVTFRS